LNGKTAAIVVEIQNLFALVFLKGIDTKAQGSAAHAREGDVKYEPCSG
jgi:hypothetical protein